MRTDTAKRRGEKKPQSNKDGKHVFTICNCPQCMFVVHVCGIRTTKFSASVSLVTIEQKYRRYQNVNGGSTACFLRGTLPAHWRVTTHSTPGGIRN